MSWRTIDLAPNALSDFELNQRVFRNGRWADPRSVILLLACNAMVVPPEVLVGMASAFVGARAGAVVGTEERVFTDFCERVGKRLVDGLTAAESKGLGTVVRTVREELLREYNPLAFTLTAFGSADLTVQGD